MDQRQRKVTIRGNPVTLVGRELKVGDAAPDVELHGNDLQPKKLSAYRGRTLILSSVPSLDTPVCDKEIHRFNQEAAAPGFGPAVVAVSMDLPFAQVRWCGAAGVKNVTTLSDHREAAFGQAYGVLIQEARLLARAVWVVDKNGVIQYQEIVPEVAQEPDYNAALAVAKKLG